MYVLMPLGLTSQFSFWNLDHVFHAPIRQVYSENLYLGSDTSDVIARLESISSNSGGTHCCYLLHLLPTGWPFPIVHHHPILIGILWNDG